MSKIENTWRLAPVAAAQHELAEVRAALGFLPQGYAAIAGLDRLADLLAAAGPSPTSPVVSTEPDEPITVTVNHDPRGVSVGVWQGSHCVYSGAHPLPASPGVSKVEDAGAQKEAVMDAIAAALGEAYDCTRVWEAWSHGTMGPDDFSLVAEDGDRVAEIADAAIAAMRPAPAAGDALGVVTLVTRQGRGQELFTYTSQPCDNVIAWRIGEACSKASHASAGDYIDRGLSLLKELQRKGYGIADISAAQRKGDA